MKTCKKCGSMQSEGNEFCSNCGNSLDSNEEWYYDQGESYKGPYTKKELIDLAKSNVIKKDTLVGNNQLTNWIAFEETGFYIGDGMEDNFEENQTINTGSDLMEEDGEDLNTTALVEENDLEAESDLETGKTEEQWYYAIGQEKIGPVSYQDVVSSVQNKVLSADDLVWKAGMNAWEEVKNTEFFQYIPKTMEKPKVELNNYMPTKQNDFKMAWLLIIAAALILSVAGGSFLARQHLISEELKQAEAIQSKKEEEAKKAEEEKQKAEQEAQQKEQEEKNKLNGTYRCVVVGDTVNIRTGAGMHYADVGDLGYGNKVSIIETKEEGQFLWGKMEDGNWTCIKRGSEVYLEKIK